MHLVNVVISVFVSNVIKIEVILIYQNVLFVERRKLKNEYFLVYHLNKLEFTDNVDDSFFDYVIFFSLEDYNICH